MARRLPDDELEKDPLIDFYARVMDFYYTHKQNVIGGAIVTLLVVTGLFGYNYYSSNQEEKAQQLLSVAEQYFRNGDYQKALSGDDIELTIGFKQIANNYGGTDAGNLAYYYASVSAYRIGNPEQALEYIENFDVPYGILGVGPLSFHASLLSELERYEEAANKYLEAAKWDENQSTTPANYYQAAEAFHNAGKLRKATKYVDLILEKYSSSAMSVPAERLKGTLEVKLAKAGTGQ